MEKGAAPFENNLEGGAFQVSWMILRILMIMMVMAIVMLIIITERVAPFDVKQNLVHGSDCLNFAYFKEKVSLPLVETS